jgi:hypothetical protein
LKETPKGVDERIVDRRSFVSGAVCACAFGEPLSQRNVPRDSLHPILKKMG